MNLITIGDVGVWRKGSGEPWSPSLMGSERAAALRAWRDPASSGDTEVVWRENEAMTTPRVNHLSEYTFWHAPWTGPRREITRDEVRWE